MKRILKPETLLPLLVVLLLSAGLFSCRKDEPNGKQYSLSTTFMRATHFPVGSRWVFIDSALGTRFDLTIRRIDSTILAAGPGFAGYRYYRYTFALDGDTSLVRTTPDTTIYDTIPRADTTLPDSIRATLIKRDSALTRFWRVLPLESVLAGNILGTREQALFFHDSLAFDGSTRERLRYDGRRLVRIRIGDLSTMSFSGSGTAGDTLSMTEFQWDPGQNQGQNQPLTPANGLVRFRTRSGRVFLLDSLRVPGR